MLSPSRGRRHPPGGLTGWGLLFLMDQEVQFTSVQLLSRILLFATPWTVAYQGFSIHGMFQARVLEWGAIAFSKLVATSY